MTLFTVLHVRPWQLVSAREGETKDDWGVNEWSKERWDSQAWAPFSEVPELGSDWLEGGDAANFYSLSFTYILTQLYILPYHFIYSDRMIQHVTDGVLVVRISTTLPTPSGNCEGSCESIKFFLLIVLREI